METEPGFDFFNLIWAVLMVPIGWIWGMIGKTNTKLDKAHERISDHELHVAEKYLRADKFDKFEERLFNQLNDIQDSLDTKQDK